MMSGFEQPTSHGKASENVTCNLEHIEESFVELDQ